MNLYPLIKQLSDGCYHTGTSLGKSLGISRTAVWKQIQRLPELALDVDADKHFGYCLKQPLDLLDRELILSLIGPGVCDKGLKLTLEALVDSTNTSLLNESVDKHWHFYIAEMQRMGKGRRGREWFSPFGSSISCSLAWTFQGSAQDLQGLSLAVGVAVKSALTELGFDGIGLKWPNDIYYKNAKVGGILIEIMGDLAGPCQLIIGIGLNVYRPVDFKAEQIEQPISYLSDAQPGQRKLRSEIVAKLCLHLTRLLEKYPDAGFLPWMEAWNSAHIWEGREAYVLTPKSREKVLLQGANSLGELVVIDTDGQQRALNSGEISLRLSQ